MRHKDCIFAAEEDCPKDSIHLTCKECEEHRAYEIIERAIRDFTGMGESFEGLFELLKKLVDSDGQSVEIKIPAESILLINRVFASFLSSTPAEAESEKIYKRMLFRCFRIFVDEFESEEYKEKAYVH